MDSEQNMVMLVGNNDADISPATSAHISQHRGYNQAFKLLLDRVDELALAGRIDDAKQLLVKGIEVARHAAQNNLAELNARQAKANNRPAPNTADIKAQWMVFFQPLIDNS